MLRLGEQAYLQNKKKEEALSALVDDLQVKSQANTSSVHNFALIVPEDDKDMKSDTQVKQKYCRVGLWKWQ